MTFNKEFCKYFHLKAIQVYVLSHCHTSAAGAYLLLQDHLPFFQSGCCEKRLKEIKVKLTL